MSNPIAKAVKFYQKVVPSPLIHAALLGTGAWWATKKLTPTIQDVGIKLALATTGKANDPQTLARAQQVAQQQRQTPLWQKHVPITAGILAGLISMAGVTNFDKKWNNWLTWNPPDKLVKKESLNKSASLWEFAGYQPSCKFDQVVNSNAVMDIFRTNPILRDDSYARNLGTSIVAAAPKFGYQNTTLGNIYDSAMNKFQNKLTLHGIAKQGAKGFIAGSLAGMFTDTVGTVMGLPPSARAPITKSVALGSALYSILT